MAALFALGFVYGFRDDDTAALRAARNLPPPQSINKVALAPAASQAQQQQQLQQQATFPSTVLPGEVPIGAALSSPALFVLQLHSAIVG